MLALTLLGFAAPVAAGTDVGVVGLFPGKAVLVIDGGAPTTLSIGGSASGVKLLGTDANTATLEVDGRRRRLAIGERAVALGQDSAGGALMLKADNEGHFLTEGSVNGASVRFLVDTGATLVSLGAGDAVRAGILYRKGEPMNVMTANGIAQVWRVKVGTLKLGDITLHDVDAAVHASNLPIGLLGMSFLNRMEMKRDGDTMTLRKRF
jgi:aspartyl protease family protein